MGMALFCGFAVIAAIAVGVLVTFLVRRVQALLKISLAIVCALIVLIGAVVLRPAWTPRIDGADSIASLDAVNLNGYRQWILVRGDHRSDPVILFLHGGPGMAAMYLAHTSTRLLERHFVVVHWDRRDAGKSFNPRMPISEESVSQQLADAEALVRLLRTRFGDRPLILVAHSWGTYLGMLIVERHPGWFAAYVGMGQVTDPSRATAVSDRWITAEATRRGNELAMREMKSDPDAYREEWLFRFGGELHHSTSYWPLLLGGLMAPEYTFQDAMNVKRGPQYAARYMKYDVIDKPISQAVTSVKVPVFLFAGRYDENTPSGLGVAYFERLSAPCKKVVWFDQSAHFPFFEQPRFFAQQMQDVLKTPCVVARIHRTPD